MPQVSSGATNKKMAQLCWHQSDTVSSTRELDPTIILILIQVRLERRQDQERRERALSGRKPSVAVDEKPPSESRGRSRVLPLVSQGKPKSRSIVQARWM